VIFGSSERTPKPHQRSQRQNRQRRVNKRNGRKNDVGMAAPRGGDLDQLHEASGCHFGQTPELAPRSEGSATPPTIERREARPRGPALAFRESVDPHGNAGGTATFPRADRVGGVGGNLARFFRRILFLEARARIHRLLLRFLRMERRLLGIRLLCQFLDSIK
jgi:hypothetical protein